MVTLRFRSRLVLAAALVVPAVAVAQKPAPLVVISIDGMKPESVTRADEHGLKIPVLRAFLTQGTYAEGVIGVIPTVTYPSHTTMMTGVWPAEHGIVDNTVFDPYGKHTNEWYLNFSDIKVPTLYTQASAAGLKTGAVSWPVTVGAPIDYLIAEYAQSEMSVWPKTGIHHPEDILEKLGVKTDVWSDETRTAESIAILKTYQPDLMLIHLANLDHQEHEHGPFSAEANASLEVIDGQVGEIAKAVYALNPKARIAIVSDHGFWPVEKHTNLNVLFVQAGLVQMAPTPKTGGGKKKDGVVEWKAEAWPAGGSNAIMVKDDDPAVTAKVGELLAKAMANPEYGIAKVLTHEEIVKRGGFPMAAFLVDFKEGFQPGGAFQGAVVTPAPHTGTHGYLPDNPGMRSTFMIEGDGIAAGRDLKVIDMRQIAPTLAGLIGVTLPAAKLAVVDVRK